MATFFTESELATITQRKTATPDRQYIQQTGPSKGSLYIGNRDGTLRFITNNFAIQTQTAVGAILTDTSSSDSIYDPSVPSIETSVNQMKLGDVLAFAAIN